MGDSASPRVVLAVDDETSVRTLVCTYLAQQGWRCLSASSVSEAMELLEREAVTHALVDLHIGQDSGFDLMRAIRRRHPQVKIVAMTGSMLSAEEESYKAGATAFLSKPFGALKKILDALDAPGPPRP